MYLYYNNSRNAHAHLGGIMYRVAYHKNCPSVFRKSPRNSGAFCLIQLPKFNI